MTRKQATPKVQRGMMTAVGMREPPRVEPPRIIEQAAPAPAPAGEAVRYVTNVSRFLQLKIVTRQGQDIFALPGRAASGEDSEDEALTRACLAHEPSGYIQFTDYVYETGHRSVAAWLDDRVRRGLLRGVARDSAQMKMRCAHVDEDGVACPFWVFNTADGRDQLAQHDIEAHSEEQWRGSSLLPPLTLGEEPRSTADMAEGDDES